MQEERRQADSKWLELQFNELYQKVYGLIYDLSKVEHNNTAVIKAEIQRIAEVAAIPTRDIPTVEELLEQAKSDPVRRKLLEATLAEMEYADPQIEFN